MKTKNETYNNNQNIYYYYHHMKDKNNNNANIGWKKEDKNKYVKDCIHRKKDKDVKKYWFQMQQS